MIRPPVKSPSKSPRSVVGDEEPAEATSFRQRNRVSEFHVVLNFFEVLKERVGN